MDVYVPVLEINYFKHLSNVSIRINYQPLCFVKKNVLTGELKVELEWKSWYVI